jgi:hypothetical protein
MAFSAKYPKMHSAARAQELLNLLNTHDTTTSRAISTVNDTYSRSLNNFRPEFAPPVPLTPQEDYRASFIVDEALYKLTDEFQRQSASMTPIEGLVALLITFWSKHLQDHGHRRTPRRPVRLHRVDHTSHTLLYLPKGTMPHLEGVTKPPCPQHMALTKFCIYFYLSTLYDEL